MRTYLKVAPLLAIVMVLSLPWGAHAATLIFSEDFDGSISSNFSGITTTVGVQGFAGFGSPTSTFSGKFLENTSAHPPVATVLTLTGLPAHTYIDLDFLLAVINSWDDTANSGYAPDYFNVSVDGVTVFTATFAHALGTASYTTGKLTATPNVDLGFSNGYPESGYDMSQEPLLHNITHTASTLTVAFFASGGGWQGGTDESWAIDNLSVSCNVIPVPGTVYLLGPALLGLWGWRRKFGR